MIYLISFGLIFFGTLLISPYYGSSESTKIKDILMSVGTNFIGVAIGIILINGIWEKVSKEQESRRTKQILKALGPALEADKNKLKQIVLEIGLNPVVRYATAMEIQASLDFEKLNTLEQRASGTLQSIVHVQRYPSVWFYLNTMEIVRHLQSLGPFLQYGVPAEIIEATIELTSKNDFWHTIFSMKMHRYDEGWASNAAPLLLKHIESIQKLEKGLEEIK